MAVLIRSFIALFEIQSDGRVDASLSLHLVFSQNTSNKNFEMAICCCRNFGKGSFDWKLKGQVLFLAVESDWEGN